jgi:hypothetical protein
MLFLLEVGRTQASYFGLGLLGLAKTTEKVGLNSLLRKKLVPEPESRARA